MKSIILATTAAVFAGSSAMAAPYVESKTTSALSDGDYTGGQTELRIGYEQKLENGVTVFGEIGPGYEWRNTGDGEAVAVGELGVTIPAGERVSVKAKVTGEYGGDTEIFDMGGELKVRYTF